MNEFARKVNSIMKNYLYYRIFYDILRLVVLIVFSCHPLLQTRNLSVCVRTSTRTDKLYVALKARLGTHPTAYGGSKRRTT